MALFAFLVLAMSQAAYAQTNWNEADAHLTGSNEVPSVSSGVTGDISVSNNADENTPNLHYSLDVFNGDEVTAAHLHCGDPGENGPVVVTLFTDANGTDVNGRLASGDIYGGSIWDVSCTSLIGYDIDSVEDLADAIEDGDIYVNVHTQAYPNGAARGQLDADDSSDDSDDDPDSHGSDGDPRKDGHGDYDNNDYKDKDCDCDRHDSDSDKKHGNRDHDHDYGSDDSDRSHDWDGKDGHSNDGRDGKDGKDGNDGYSHSKDDSKKSWSSQGSSADASSHSFIRSFTRIRID